MLRVGLPAHIRGAVATVAASVLLGACTPQVERVVLVSIDTLRADHVGSYGAARAHTPTLDGLAAEGVLFETAIAPTPLTLPSHTSLMTGLDPPRHGVRNNSTYALPEDVPLLAERFRTAGFATAAFVGAMVLDRQYGLARGFDHYDDRMSTRRSADEAGFPERTADRVVDAAVAWLESAPPRFLLWIHVYDPHANYQPPPGFRAAFPSSPYAGEIAFADAQLGRLEEALETRFPGRGTLWIATSDHGESRGEHGEWTHAYSIYDATQRVPLLMRGPDIPEGARIPTPVRLVDVAPTLLDLAGLDPLPETSGRSLRPLLSGESLQPAAAYIETLATRIDFGWSPLLGLRTAEWKYIRAPKPELYALAEDPHERRNLAADEPAIRDELDRELEQHLAGSRLARRRALPDDAERARLASLGYVVADTSSDDVPDRVGGADPKDQLPLLFQLARAHALIRAGHPEEALAAIAGSERAGMVLALVRAEAALEARDFVVAERSAREAIREAPDFPAGRWTLGEALAGLGRLEEASAAFRHGAELDPASSEPWIGLGRLAEKQGRLEEAHSSYQHAAGLRGASAEPLWRRAALLIEAGEPDAAKPLLARAGELACSTPEAALRLAHAELRVGNADNAARRLRESLERRPGHPRLARALAEIQSP